MKKIYIITVSIITISIAFFAYNFFTNQKTEVSEAALSRNGLTLDLNFGNNNGGATPTVYDTSGFNRNAVAQNAQTCNQNNCIFDSGDHMITSGNVYNTPETSIVLKFSPTFDANDGVLHYLFDSTNGARYALYKNTNNTLGFLLGNTIIQVMSLSTYEPYWKTNQENILIISGSATTDRTDVYLNGNKILDQATTAWTEANPATIYIGAYYAQSSYWANSTFHYLKVWNRLLTDNEVANLSADRKTTAQTPSRTGLIGHWNMDSNDINGTTVYDKSGRNNNGTLLTTANLLTGKINQSLDFSNQNNTITVVDNGDLTIGTKDFTWSTWVKLSASSLSQNLFVKGGVGANQVQMYIHAANVFYAYGDSGSFAINSFVTPVIGKWYLVTLTRSGTTAQMYIDGVAKGAPDTSAGADFSSTSNLVLGDNSLFFAEMDDVRVYNYALSAQEVSELYNSAKSSHTQAPSRTGLVGWWDLDSKSINGTNVYDKSGKNNHGVGTNITSDDLVSGKIGQALDFDETEYITISNDVATSTLNFGTGDFSFGAWVNPSSTGIYRTVISKGYPLASGTSVGYVLYIYDGVPGTYISDGIQRTRSGTLINDGKWHHLLVTYGVDKQTRLYQDGVLQGSPSAVGTGLSTSNIYDFIIGRYASSANNFKGKIDDVRVYNYALSDGEVANLYNSSKKTYIK